jgi:hypothetical protein
MKHHLKRTLITLLAGALLLGTASCGKRDSWLPFGEKKSSCEKAYESLESQFKDLKATVTGGKTSAARAAFWQATAALFIVLAGFALVGGAALGSRARRDRERFRQSSTTEGATTDNPEEFTA